MSTNESRHLLPMSSMIFKSSPDLRSPLPINPTLVDIRKAQDTSITALPMTTSITAKEKKSLWSRIVDKVKGLLGSKEKEINDEDDGEMEIGSPTDFKHERTGGIGSLRSPVKQRASGESEWEDV
jgi:hypothetical protein